MKMMEPTAGEGGDPVLWEVATPARSPRMAGVSMAGFRDLGRTPVGLRLIPHPAVTLALMFGAGSITVVDATGRPRRGSLVAGLGFGSVRVERAEDFECLQMRLSPLVACAVLGVSPVDLEGSVVALDDLCGRDGSRVSEQLAEASCWEDRFAVADAWLGRRRGTGPSVDGEVAWAWERIRVSRGQVRVDQMAAELGWSRKRLWLRFRDQIGLPPKGAAKLVRFDHAAHRLIAGQDAARVAADGGYTDQSHLHRDIVAFSGVTPGALPGEPFLTIDDIAWPNQEEVV
jgi:AraC-like DNA-binding protein